VTQWRSADYVFARWLAPSRETLDVLAELRGERPRRTRKPVKGVHVTQNARLPLTEYQSAPRRRADEAP
jgi:hypothetical protein